MARLRQQYPQNYISNTYINTEFESIIRYLNAAELGNKTVAELLAQIFNDEGEFEGPIEFRVDNTAGLQYRIGEFTVAEAEEGWVTIAPIADLRGPSGLDVGQIDGPIFYNREDIIVVGTPNVVTYASLDANAETILVYRNGLLLKESDYSLDFNTGIITFIYNLANNDAMTIYSIRTIPTSNFNRTDFLAVVPTSVVAFPHGPDDSLLVYNNGLLQREGALYDYTHDDVTDTVTFLSPLAPGDEVTIFTADAQTSTTVGGLMLEDEYTDGNGFITYSTLSIADGEITQAKVSGLSASLTLKANITVAALTPVSAVSGDLWLDTSQVPNILKFYDGVQWLSTNPTNSLPTFLISNANQYLRVNGTGTALEYGDLDLSSVVPKTYMGASNGVASLDSGGKLPTSQLPDVYSQSTLPFLSRWETGLATTANATYFVSYVYKQILRIDGISFKLSAGTCDVRISVDGTPLGSTYAVTTSLQQQALGSAIQVDGSTVAKRIEIAVTNQAGAGILEIGLAAASVTA